MVLLEVLHKRHLRRGRLTAVQQMTGGAEPHTV
jgi:hypothetical protein